MSAIAFIVEIHMDHYFSSLSTSQTEEPAPTDYLDPIPTTMGNHAGKASFGHTGMVWSALYKAHVNYSSTLVFHYFWGGFLLETLRVLAYRAF
jgi:hypothetical protein